MNRLLKQCKYNTNVCLTCNVYILVYILRISRKSFVQLRCTTTYDKRVCMKRPYLNLRVTITYNRFRTEARRFSPFFASNYNCLHLSYRFTMTNRNIHIFEPKLTAVDHRTYVDFCDVNIHYYC